MFQCGERHRACGFDDELVLLEHQEDHLVDVSFGHGDQVVQEFVEQCESQVARALDGNAFRRGDHLVGGNHAAGGERILERRRTLRNRANHADFGLERLDGERHAGAQTATAERYDDIGDIRDIFEDFHGDGALAANDFIIVEGRHVDHALLVAQLLGVRGGFVEHIAVQDDVGAVGFGGVNLERRGDGWHADGGFCATLAGGVGDTLRMVAGGCGDDAASQLVLGQGGDLVVGAANLEGTGDLQVLRLEENLVSGHVGQHRRGNDLRVFGRAFEPLGGLLQFSGMIALQCFENLVLFHDRYCRTVEAQACRRVSHIGAGRWLPHERRTGSHAAATNPPGLDPAYSRTVTASHGDSVRAASESAECCGS